MGVVQPGNFVTLLQRHAVACCVEPSATINRGYETAHCIDFNMPSSPTSSCGMLANCITFYTCSAS